MKKIRKILLFVLLLFVSVLITGCGEKENKEKEEQKLGPKEIISKIEEGKTKLSLVENYYNPKEHTFIKDSTDGIISTSYYDFDKDGDDEFLLSSVKDNNLVLTLYEVENEEIKEKDSIVIIEEVLDFSDIIDMNCFIKIMDDEPYIFAESIGYSNLLADGINWKFRKIGFANGKFWDVAADEFSGSYIEEDFLNAKRSFVHETGLTVDKFGFEDNGKMLYEQNKDKTANLFTIERKHLDNFDSEKYYNSNETKVKYGETKYTAEVTTNPALADYFR